MTTNSDKLEEIRKRCDAAKPGPWKRIHQGWVQFQESGGQRVGMDVEKVHVGRDDDAHFIAASREDIPYLLGVIERRDEVIDQQVTMVNDTNRWCQKHVDHYKKALELACEHISPAGICDESIPQYWLDKAKQTNEVQ